MFAAQQCNSAFTTHNYRQTAAQEPQRASTPHAVEGTGCSTSLAATARICVKTMATFRAASLVSVTELEKLVNRLTEQSQIAESQRAQLAMRLSANNRDEETQRLLARTELGLRDVKTALRELEGEKEKLVAARDCLLYTSPSPRDPKTSRMPSSA